MKHIDQQWATAIFVNVQQRRCTLLVILIQITSKEAHHIDNDNKLEMSKSVKSKTQKVIFDVQIKTQTLIMTSTHHVNNDKELEISNIRQK